MNDIRQGYLVFPGWTQNYWTWVTGKALPGQNPLFRLSPIMHFWTAFVPFIAGFVVSTLAFYNYIGFAWIVVGWFMVLAGSRKLAAVILHQCVHLLFTGHRKFDKFVGEFVTTLMCTQDAASYRHDHFGLHHRALTFATENDPIVQFLAGQGMTKTSGVDDLYRAFYLKIFSPIFHLRFFYCRLVYNLRTCGHVRRLASTVFWAALFAAAYFADNGFMALLLIYAVPMILLYQISAFIEICSEHAWLVAEEDDIAYSDKKLHHVHKSWGRFCGARVPTNDGGLIQNCLAWIGFWVATLFYHLPVRLFILVGDLPQHDFHHRLPHCEDWVISAYARQRDIDAGHPGWPPYKDFWGIHNAIRHVFSGMSIALQSPADEPDTAGMQTA